jgi:hypothetical protein
VCGYTFTRYRSDENKNKQQNKKNHNVSLFQTKELKVKGRPRSHIIRQISGILPTKTLSKGAGENDHFLKSPWTLVTLQLQTIGELTLHGVSTSRRCL